MPSELTAALAGCLGCATFLLASHRAPTPAVRAAIWILGVPLYALGAAPWLRWAHAESLPWIALGAAAGAILAWRRAR